MTALAYIETSPRVSPHCVFAARRKLFHVTVRGVFTAEYAKYLVFDELPLEAHGWNFDRTSIRHIITTPFGMIFRVERG